MAQSTLRRVVRRPVYSFDDLKEILSKEFSYLGDARREGMYDGVEAFGTSLRSGFLSWEMDCASIDVRILDRNVLLEIVGPTLDFHIRELSLDGLMGTSCH